MFQVLALQSASKLFPEHSAKFRETINELFLHLRRYYSKNFDCVAVKMGNLIIMLELIAVSYIHKNFCSKNRF